MPTRAVTPEQRPDEDKEAKCIDMTEEHLRQKNKHCKGPTAVRYLCAKYHPGCQNGCRGGIM